MPPKLNHEELMSHVCGVCARNNKSKDKTKFKLIRITLSLLQDIRDVHYSNYNTRTMPQVICDKCRLKIKRRKEVHSFFFIRTSKNGPASMFLKLWPNWASNVLTTFLNFLPIFVNFLCFGKKRQVHIFPALF